MCESNTASPISHESLDQSIGAMEATVVAYLHALHVSDERLPVGLVIAERRSCVANSGSRETVYGSLWEHDILVSFWSDEELRDGQRVFWHLDLSRTLAT